MKGEEKRKRKLGRMKERKGWRKGGKWKEETWKEKRKKDRVLKNKIFSESDQSK